MSRTVHPVPTFCACPLCQRGAASFGMTVGLGSPRGAAHPEVGRGTRPFIHRVPFPAREYRRCKGEMTAWKSGVFLIRAGARGERRAESATLSPPLPSAAHAGSGIKGNLPSRGVSAPGMSAPARHGIFTSPGAYSTGEEGGGVGGFGRERGGGGEDSQPAAASAMRSPPRYARPPPPLLRSVASGRGVSPPRPSGASPPRKHPALPRVSFTSGAARRGGGVGGGGVES